MGWTKRLVAILATVFMGVAVAGCSTPPTQSDLIGTWEMTGLHLEGVDGNLLQQSEDVGLGFDLEFLETGTVIQTSTLDEDEDMGLEEQITEREGQWSLGDAGAVTLTWGDEIWAGVLERKQLVLTEDTVSITFEKAQ